MIKKLLLSTVVGAIIAYIWGAVSWTAIPWHMATFSSFADDTEVAAAIKANADQHGVYLLPYPYDHDPNAPKEKQETAQRLHKEGPFAFLVVQPKGVDPNMGKQLGFAVVNQLLAALIISYLLLQVGWRCYRRRVFFVVVVALLAGVLCHLPYLNWWGFTTLFTLLAFVDLLIGWFLAGLAMAKICKPAESS